MSLKDFNEVLEELSECQAASAPAVLHSNNRPDPGLSSPLTAVLLTLSGSELRDLCDLFTASTTTTTTTTSGDGGVSDASAAAVTARWLTFLGCAARSGGGSGGERHAVAVAVTDWGERLWVHASPAAAILKSHDAAAAADGTGAGDSSLQLTDATCIGGGPLLVRRAVPSWRGFFASLFSAERRPTHTVTAESATTSGGVAASSSSSSPAAATIACGELGYTPPAVALTPLSPLSGVRGYVQAWLATRLAAALQRTQASLAAARRRCTALEEASAAGNRLQPGFPGSRGGSASTGVSQPREGSGGGGGGGEAVGGNNATARPPTNLANPQLRVGQKRSRGMRLS